MTEYDKYLEQAKEFHKGVNNWPGNSITKHFPVIAEIIRDHEIKTVLNYGCGKARHNPVEWMAENYDPAVPGIDVHPKGSFDLVVCCDVMEHIPEDFIGTVLDEIFNYSLKYVYLSIACFPARAVLPNGDNAHCTVRSPEWWREKLAGRKNCTVVFDLGKDKEAVLFSS